MDGNFWENLQNFKLPIALSLLGLVLILGGIFTSSLNKSKQKDFPKESMVEVKTISVDVSGAVQKPGVYKLKEGSRIEEAIGAAGGFSKNANQEYISKYLNLAQKLVDGSKIYVPFEGETSISQGSQVAGANVSTKININTANQSELESLSGVGPVTASKIISNRPYQKIEELLEKKIVGKSVFEKIKESIAVY